MAEAGGKAVVGVDVAVVVVVVDNDEVEAGDDTGGVGPVGEEVPGSRWHNEDGYKAAWPRVTGATGTQAAHIEPGSGVVAVPGVVVVVAETECKMSAASVLC